MPLLGLHPDAVSHASDYFGAMIADAAALIESGLLYADDTPVELVSTSSCRSNRRCCFAAISAFGLLTAAHSHGCVTQALRNAPCPAQAVQPQAQQHTHYHITALLVSAATFHPIDPTRLLLCMQMRQQRLAKQASAARDRPTAASLAAWAEMQAGSDAGQAYCLRFRLQPCSDNSALRDPVAYRVILEPHYKTGENKWVELYTCGSNGESECTATSCGV
jgi:hypothetical protein